MKQDLQLPVLLKPAQYQVLTGSARGLLKAQHCDELYQREQAALRQQQCLINHIDDLCDCE